MSAGRATRRGAARAPQRSRAPLHAAADGPAADRLPSAPPRFDRVVVVDWSASSTPARGADSIWIATIGSAGGTPLVENLPTRRAAEERLTELSADTGATTLIGVDFSLGFPAGTADALGFGGTPWRALWERLTAELDDDERNRNNRFELAAALNARVGAGPGPFWGCPATRAVDGLAPTKPLVAPLPEWRAVEVELRARRRRPFSVWQLLGAGAVGSQSLVGIPVLERLRCRSSGRCHIWPFSTGLGLPPTAPGDVVVAEVWPSLVDADVTGGRIRDAAQVDATANWLAELDRAGRLAALFAPVLPASVARGVTDEEGWILGVVPAGGTPDGDARAGGS